VLCYKAYHLKSDSHGSGNSRFTVLKLTARTSLNTANHSKIKKILRKESQGDFVFSNYNWTKYGGEGPGKKGKGRRTQGGGGLGGEKVVGQGAEKLGEDHIGYKILSKMG
jgi:hypothetical protein